MSSILIRPNQATELKESCNGMTIAEAASRIHTNPAILKKAVLRDMVPGVRVVDGRIVVGSLQLVKEEASGQMEEFDDEGEE